MTNYAQLLNALSGELPFPDGIVGEAMSNTLFDLRAEAVKKIQTFLEKGQNKFMAYSSSVRAQKKDIKELQDRMKLNATMRDLVHKALTIELDDDKKFLVLHFLADPNRACGIYKLEGVKDFNPVTMGPMEWNISVLTQVLELVQQEDFQVPNVEVDFHTFTGEIPF